MTLFITMYSLQPTVLLCQVIRIITLSPLENYLPDEITAKKLNAGNYQDCKICFVHIYYDASITKFKKKIIFEIGTYLFLFKTLLFVLS